MKNNRKAEYHAYLQSPEWRAKRIAVFNEKGRICSKCKATDHLQIHHLTYERIYNEPMEDLIVLCRSCHEVVHNRAKKKRQKKSLKEKLLAEAKRLTRQEKNKRKRERKEARQKAIRKKYHY